MALRNWLAATATLATPATVGGESGPSVATVATVAVAVSANDGDATPEQARELRELVSIVAADWPAAERAEALAVALSDPEAALMSFRALASERNGLDFQQ